MLNNYDSVSNNIAAKCINTPLSVYLCVFMKHLFLCCPTTTESYFLCCGRWYWHQKGLQVWNQSNLRSSEQRWGLRVCLGNNEKYWYLGGGELLFRAERKLFTGVRVRWLTLFFDISLSSGLPLHPSHSYRPFRSLLSIPVLLPVPSPPGNLLQRRPEPPSSDIPESLLPLIVFPGVHFGRM